MANNENLKPIRSKKEAREKGKIGGIKSGKARRERKALKEELILLLSQDNIQEKISLALINKALSGDVRAFETIRDTIGEKPTDKQELNADKPIIIEVANEEDKKMLEKLANHIKSNSPIIVDDI